MLYYHINNSRCDETYYLFVYFQTGQYIEKHPDSPDVTAPVASHVEDAAELQLVRLLRGDHSGRWTPGLPVGTARGRARESEADGVHCGGRQNV